MPRIKSWREMMFDEFRKLIRKADTLVDSYMEQPIGSEEARTRLAELNQAHQSGEWLKVERYAEHG